MSEVLVGFFKYFEVVIYPAYIRIVFMKYDINSTKRHNYIE